MKANPIKIFFLALSLAWVASCEQQVSQGKEIRNHWKENNVTKIEPLVFNYGMAKKSVDVLLANFELNTDNELKLHNELSNHLAGYFTPDSYYREIRTHALQNLDDSTIAARVIARAIQINKNHPDIISVSFSDILRDDANILNSSSNNSIKLVDIDCIDKTHPLFNTEATVLNNYNQLFKAVEHYKPTPIYYELLLYKSKSNEIFGTVNIIIDADGKSKNYDTSPSSAVSLNASLASTGLCIPNELAGTNTSWYADYAVSNSIGIWGVYDEAVIGGWWVLPKDWQHLNENQRELIFNRYTQTNTSDN